MSVTSFAFGARKRSVTDLSALISGETTGGPPRPPPRPCGGAGGAGACPAGGVCPAGVCALTAPTASIAAINQ